MEKLVAVRNHKGYNLVKMSLDIEDCLNMNFFIANNETKNDINENDSNIINFIKKFNQIIWDVKVDRIFPNINNFSGEELNDYLRDSIEECFREELFEKELPFSNTSLDYLDKLNPKKFQGSSSKVINQLEFFNQMPIPEKTKGFIQEYVDRIEEIELTKAQLKSIYTQFAEPITELQEFVMYIGDNKKYKGAVGKIIGHREDVAPFLIEFRNIKGNNEKIKYWSKEENIVRFFV